MEKQTPGYTLGRPEVARSPVSLADFERIKNSVLFTAADLEALHLSEAVVADQVEAILDVWYGFVASQPQLLSSFSSPSGQPQAEYLAAVRKRFARWIIDTAHADYGQAWLDYQHEIGLRHYRAKKNLTDSARASAIVPFRDLFALVFPVTITLKPFLANKGHTPAQVEAMHAAWVKSCLLQVTLWSYPYVKDGDF
jgi:hypothetical protein